MPRGSDRPYRLGDHDGLGVRSHHLGDQLVGTTGKSQSLSIIALRLPIGVQANNGDDNIRLGCQLDGLSHHHIGVLDFCATESDAGVAVLDCLVLVAVCRSPDVAELDENVVPDACLEVDFALFLLRTAIEERLPAALARPIIND